MTATPGIGHNGGPRQPLPRKLSPAQTRALGWMRDDGNAAYGLSGRTAFGSACGTAVWLHRNGLAAFHEGERRNRSDCGQRLTARGERVLAAGCMV